MNYKEFFRQNIDAIMSIKKLAPKSLKFEEINYNKGFQEDAELFSLIDPVLNLELNDVNKKSPLYDKLVSMIPFGCSTR